MHISRADNTFQLLCVRPFFHDSRLYNKRLHIDQLQCCRDQSGTQRINVSKYAFNKRDREKKKRRAQCNVAYIRHAADPVAKNATPLSHLSNSNRSFVRSFSTSSHTMIPRIRSELILRNRRDYVIVARMVDDSRNSEREEIHRMSLS